MSRTLEIDALKYVLACAVIGLHCQFLSEYDARLSYLLVNGVFRAAVPLFFMMSGYFIAESRIILVVKRTALLYALWMAIYAPFWLWGLPYDMREDMPLWQDVIFGYYHLWYLPALIVGLLLHKLMLLFPSALQMLVALGAALLGIYLQYEHNYGWVDVPVLAYRNGICMAYPFLAIGAALARMQLTTLNPYIHIAGLVLSGVMLIREASLNYELIFVGEGQRQPFDILTALYFFCPLMLLGCARYAARPTSGKVGRISLYIYLLHPLVIVLLWQLGNIPATLLTIMTLCITTLIAAVYVRATN